MWDVLAFIPVENVNKHDNYLLRYMANENSNPAYILTVLLPAALYACGLSYRKAVRPSVCLSVKRVNCDKTNESSVDILIPYERSIRLVFRHEEWLVEDVLSLIHI